ncbi:lantibiotic dehydratase family protein [Nocardiopsis sp. CNT-189]|uniref:lantibiotic dehydratase family protein n=1 Tax=Nocardiopsis oceanisediminis TaxID=2816862 RepID=UPI003B298713
MLALLQAAVADPLLVEAVALASSSLSGVLDRVASGNAGGLSDKRLRKAVLSVQRYDVRLRTRPTPFGVFAGVCAGRFGPSAKIARGRRHRTRTRMDMEWLQSIVHRLERDPAVLRGVRVQSHQALVVSGGRVVLPAPSTQGAPVDASAPSRVSVRASAPVLLAVERAVRPLPFSELSALAAERFPGTPMPRIEGLLTALIGQEILITSLRPPLNGSDPLDHLLAVLPAEGSLDGDSGRIHGELVELDRMRKEYDETPVGCGHRELVGLRTRAEALEAAATPLHIDTGLDAEVRFPEEVRREVERTAEVLWKLSTPRLGMRSLRSYHAWFLERYGVDRMVPLLELLDENRSLGAPPGYDWPPSERPEEQPEEAYHARRDRALARLVADALRYGLREVRIDDEVLAELVRDRADEADLPNSCELYVHVVAPSEQAMESGEFRVVPAPNPGSHHAGATLGRFADLLGPVQAEFEVLRSSVPGHVRGAVTADLSFTPRSGKAANLAHVAPHTGARIASGLPDVTGPEELRLSDLAVGATLERFCVVHVPTGREVLPVLPSMISPEAQASNPVRFLHEAGNEGQRLWEPWDWGPMANAPFLPGVRYGRTQLAPPTWRLDPLCATAASQPSAEEWGRALDAWREEWRPPRRILALSTDQRLMLDLDDP